MITTNGKVHIKRFMAGSASAIARAVAIGLADTPESVNDTELRFETARAEIILSSFDFAENRLIFKIIVPDTGGGIIREVGLYSEIEQNSSESAPRMLSSFDSETEEWVVPTTGAASEYFTNLPSTPMNSRARIGNDSLRQAPAASATRVDALRDISLDLSHYSGSDTFTIAALVSASSGVSSVKVRFLTDSINYYDLTYAASNWTPAGYKIVSLPKAAAVAVGVPDWSNITEIQISTTATATPAAVHFDGLRINTLEENTNQVLVARQVLTTPLVKEESKNQELEFALDINI